MRTANAEQAEVAREGFASIKDVESYLSVSRSTIYQLMDSGKLPFAKIGKARRIPWQAIRQFGQDCLVNPR
jgi:excisionase family DNA binding protein